MECWWFAIGAGGVGGFEGKFGGGMTAGRMRLYRLRLNVCDFYRKESSR